MILFGKELDKLINKRLEDFNSRMILKAKLWKSNNFNKVLKNVRKTVTVLKSLNKEGN